VCFELNKYLKNKNIHCICAAIMYYSNMYRDLIYYMSV